MKGRIVKMDKGSEGFSAWNGRRMRSKILHGAVRLVLFGLLFLFCYYLPTVAVTVMNAPHKAQALSTVPVEHRGNVYLQNRGMGSSRYLKGDVKLYVFFVSDGVSNWTRDAIDAANNEYSLELAILEKEAWRYGTSLDVTCEYYEVVREEAILGDTSDAWYKDVLRAAGFKVVEL